MACYIQITGLNTTQIPAINSKTFLFICNHPAYYNHNQCVVCKCAVYTIGAMQS